MEAQREPCRKEAEMMEISGGRALLGNGQCAEESVFMDDEGIVQTGGPAPSSLRMSEFPENAGLSQQSSTSGCPLPYHSTVNVVAKALHVQ